MTNKPIAYARAQGVDFFFTFTLGSPSINQLSGKVQFSDDDVDWYEDDSQGLLLNTHMAALADRPIRHHVNVGSRQHKYARMVFDTTTSQTTASQVTVDARVTGVYSSPWSSDPQVAN